MLYQTSSFPSFLARFPFQSDALAMQELGIPGAHSSTAKEVFFFHFGELIHSIFLDCEVRGE